MKAKTRDQIRLWLTAAGVATLAIALLAGTMAYAPGIYRHEINWKWVRYTVITIAFVVFCLKTYWGARKHLGFWVILLGVFAIHFIGVGYFYYAAAGLPLLVFGPVVALEWALLALTVYYFLGIGPPTRNH